MLVDVPTPKTILWILLQQDEDLQIFSTSSWQRGGPGDPKDSSLSLVVAVTEYLHAFDVLNFREWVYILVLSTTQHAIAK